MSTLAKVFVVLNLLLAVAFLGAAAAFLGHSDKVFEMAQFHAAASIALE